MNLNKLYKAKKHTILFKALHRCEIRWKFSFTKFLCNFKYYLYQSSLYLVYTVQHKHKHAWLLWKLQPDNKSKQMPSNKNVEKDWQKHTRFKWFNILFKEIYYKPSFVFIVLHLDKKLFLKMSIFHFIKFRNPPI